MKEIGSLVLAVLVGIVAIWLVFKVLVGALKLIGLLIVIGVVVAIFYAVKGRIEGPRA
jgi:hypothetical protein